MPPSRIIQQPTDLVPDRQPEYERWLIRVETRAMLPLKMVILLVSVVYWMWREHFNPPSTLVFLLFMIYGMLTLAQGYFFWRDRIATSQARILVTVSFVVDMAFVSFLVFYSITGYSVDWKFFMLGDFHLFYLLLVLRGFALFRTTEEGLLIAAIMSGSFAASLIYYMQNQVIMPAESDIVTLGLIWFILMATMVVTNLMSQQQAESLRVRERMLRIEGLATLGELTAGVAHEINNPIGIIKAYAEFLKKSSKEGEQNFDDFETIRAEAERCEGIVRRMLDYANPNVRELKVISVRPLLEEVSQFVFDQRHQEQGIEFRLNCSPSLPSIYVDEAQIRQALLNVLLNARQVLEKSDEQTRVVEVTAMQQKGARAPIEILIHNSGPAIDPKDAEKAFEPFYTRRQGGTGLGLAITRRIIEAHAGEISIWPADSGGTACSIVLPIYEKD